MSGSDFVDEDCLSYSGSGAASRDNKSSREVIGVVMPDVTAGSVPLVSAVMPEEG